MLQYGKKTSFTVKVPKSLASGDPEIYPQPITENAFLYGCLRRGRDGNTDLLSKGGGQADIDCIGQWKGMAGDMETLKGDIRAGMETKHIGLSNVNQRIQLLYGKEYGLVLPGKKGRDPGNGEAALRGI